MLSLPNWDKLYSSAKPYSTLPQGLVGRDDNDTALHIPSKWFVNSDFVTFVTDERLRQNAHVKLVLRENMARFVASDLNNLHWY